MAKYNLMIQLAIRELEIDIHGTKIKVTERLFKDPKRVQEIRAKIVEGRDSLAEIVEKLRNKAPDDKPSESTAATEMEGLLTQMQLALAHDERMTLCEEFCERIVATDITLDVEESLPEVSMPLKPQELYDSVVSSDLLTAILEKVKAEPIVPKA